MSKQHWCEEPEGKITPVELLIRVYGPGLRNPYSSEIITIGLYDQPSGSLTLEPQKAPRDSNNTGFNVRTNKLIEPIFYGDIVRIEGSDGVPEFLEVIKPASTGDWGHP